MYLYKVGFYSCEESYYLEFSHERKYSHQELDDIIVDCYAEVYRLIRGANEKDYLVACSRPYGLIIKFQDLLYDPSFAEAMEARGFSRVTYETTNHFFGWRSAIDENDWKERNKDDPENDREVQLIRKLREKLS